MKSRLAIAAALFSVLGSVVPVAAATGPAAAPPFATRASDLRVVPTAVADLVFASWEEGNSGSRDWVSVSLDGGRSWSEPRRMSRRLELLNGGFRPEGVSAVSVPARLAARPGTALRIVQLSTPSLAALRARLRELGAEIVAFLPESAHIVRMSAESEAKVAAESFVRWVGPFHPVYRIEPELLDELVGAEAGGPTRRYNLMTATPGAGEKAVLGAEIRALGGSVVRANPNGYIVEAELSAAQAAELVHSDHLLWLERWSAPEPDMDIVRNVGGANYIEGVGNFSGQGVAGEVLDGGVDLTHQDFDGIQAHGTINSPGCHGSSTYGIVFGNGDRDGDGDRQATGLLPSGTGWAADYSSLTDRYQHTLELTQPPIQAVFQSNSWGSARTLHYTALSNEMDDIVWLHDFQIFQSQSNSGDQYSRPQAWAKNVISIGAVYHRDTAVLTDDCFCNGASIGPAEDGRLKPDLSHWYDDIYTTNSAVPPPDGCGAAYTTGFGGTSAATPIVAGIGGLVYQMWAANVLGNNPPGSTVFEKRPHPSTLKALLIATADPYPFTGLGVDMARVRQGWGLPNARNVYNRASTTKVVDETRPLRELERAVYRATVTAGQPDLRISMVYTDRAATPGAAIHRVNDLSLRVTAPDGAVYRGNVGLVDGIWSMPGGSADHLNNVENVFVPTPLAGEWRVEVLADEVNQDQHVETVEDDQDFGLVVSGASALSECLAQVAPPAAVTATVSGDNAALVSWTGSAPSYEVWRSLGGCSAPSVLAGTTATTNLLDSGIAGGLRYGYRVRAISGCASGWSSCQEVVPTGNCNLAPTFAGLARAGAVTGATCGIQLEWAAGSSGGCTGPVVYNIYRSTNPAFTPDAASRLFSCVTGTSWLDTRGLQSAQEYTYIVRAEDRGARGGGPCGGIEEGNLLRRSLTPRTLFRTDFEPGLDGWMSVPLNNGVTGEWVVDDPEGTANGADPAQPEDDHTATGVRALYTGRNPNRSLSQADIDFGEVVALSPVFDAQSFGSVRVTLWRWYYNRDRDADTTDFFLVEASNDGGSNWVQLERLDDQQSVNSWTRVTFDLAGFLPLTATMQLRVRASEAGNMSNVIEAAIDDVEVIALNACTTAVGALGVVTATPGPLLGAKQGANAHFQWGADCGTGTSYGVYRGDLASGLGSLAPVVGACDLAGTSIDVPLTPASQSFYLVAPNDGSREGSLGLLDIGVRRPQPATVCYPRAATLDACAP